MNLEQLALPYHANGRPGKIEVVATKPCRTAEDLSLAYTPGVAGPCRKIDKNPDDVYKYTAKGNLVAVVSNGTAILGLGNLGPEASKPVMEGKGVLFKRFADIDVFDIEINAPAIEDVIKACEYLEPTFGGINLEDIKAPECFVIEEELKKRLNIPVFHDDQHGTAIICTAGFINALELTGKKAEDVKIVFSGAGASAISCARLMVVFGARRENIVMCDSKGVIYKGRGAGMNRWKEEFATEREVRTMEEAFVGCDVAVGLSVGGMFTKEMVASMAKDPVIFAMANPDPEITPEDALSVREDIIMATGRSDYPNQVNNVLGFPFIFRGALDVRASDINEEMKAAAARALAGLAKEPVPRIVRQAYGDQAFSFGPDYIIPKPFDVRVLYWVAPAVAQAAMETGVARKTIDLDEYRDSLTRIFNPSRNIIQTLIARAKQRRPRILFPEGTSQKVLEACRRIIDREFAFPVLVGSTGEITTRCKELDIDMSGLEIIDRGTYSDLDNMVEELYEQRKHKGMTAEIARNLLAHNDHYFGAMLFRRGVAHAMLSGATCNYPDAIRPALQVVGMADGVSRVYGLYIMVTRSGVYLFTDTSVNHVLNAEELAEAAILSAGTAETLGLEPRVAMVCYSNFGNARGKTGPRMREAAAIVRKRRPDIMVVGEVQADYAVVEELAEQRFPWFGGAANILIFPNLNAANISYKLLQRLGGAEAIGPILLGMGKPVNIISPSADATEIVNLAAVTAAELVQSGSAK